ncbi:hypothetical protein EVAR_36329_1 [Eumeta japonica]|uniref:Uncharacterized protein n=1 Tax=Eumeta variegata TaxID=151549 RepID=A0A4C1VHF4_EUMVA|nr:hypothetical protein EVAR_36329_1 [Eumeta japonica]
MVKNEILDIVDTTSVSKFRWNFYITRLAKRLSSAAYEVKRIRQLTARRCIPNLAVVGSGAGRAPHLNATRCIVNSFRVSLPFPRALLDGGSRAENRVCFEEFNSSEEPLCPTNVIDVNRLWISPGSRPLRSHGAVGRDEDAENAAGKTELSGGCLLDVGVLRRGQPLAGVDYWSGQYDMLLIIKWIVSDQRA